MTSMRRWIVGLFVLLAGAAVQADPMRGVYINGKVHYFTLTGNAVQHQAGIPNASWVWTAQQTHTVPLNAGYDYVYLWGEGKAVLNNKIYYFPIGVPGNNTKNGRTLYCASFDLTSNTFDTTVRSLCQVNANYMGVGSAAVTYSPPDQTQSTLYVFADSKTYTSGDGVNWASHDPLRSPSEMVEPIDAIVFYPPDSEPMIMVVYMQQASYYAGQGLYAAIWNGKFGSASQMTWTKISNDVVYGGALILGTAGNASPYDRGAARPCVQLFTNSFNRYEYAYDLGGTTWTKGQGQWLASDDYYVSLAFPWYLSECNQAQDNQDVRQHIILNAEKATSRTGEGTAWVGLTIPSDGMVPINTTDLGVNCNAWGGSTNPTDISDDSTDPDAMTYRKYWTLIGVITGSPPFSLNGWEGFELEDFSNVTYGSQASGQVSHSEERENTLMFSAGVTVMAGLAHIFEVEDEVDLGYKYGWQSSHETTSTSTKGFDQTFGTSLSNTAVPDEMGKYGWALFDVPNIVVQDYAIYAYDYNVDTQSGTYLNQDLHSTQVLGDEITVVPKAFELANPGGPDDDVPNLLTGMGPFSKSTDLDWWNATPWTWESKTSPWSVVLGEKTDATVPENLINTLTFTNGAGGTVYFSQEQEDVQTAGYTSDIDISDKASLTVGTKLKGFKLNLAAGYESHFASSVSNSTSWEKSVTADIGMKPTNDPDGVKSMTIQPYFLKAANPVNGQVAPWVPANYSSQRPWCMTWAVKSYATNSGTHVGTSAPPSSFSATVVGGKGASSDPGAPKWSSVSIKDGPLTWAGEDGAPGSGPLTADDFDPNAGATVSVNGHAVSASRALGRWTRTGQVWTFEPRDSVKHDRVALKLDFGTHTWDLDLGKADLSPNIPPSPGDIRVLLVLNGRYGFRFTGEPQIHTKWAIEAPRTPADDVDLTGYSGEYDSAKGEGTVTLKGGLPRSDEGLGDMAFTLNGHKVSVPLMALKGYDQAVAKGKELSYDEGGLHLLVDYGKRTWKATFKKGSFHPLLAPRWGRTRILVSVGGVTALSREYAITDHTTKLSHKG